jgi:hypothetical protein
MSGPVNTGTGALSSGLVGVIQWLPAAVTFTKVNAIVSAQGSLPLIGTSLSVRADLYKYTTGGGATAVPGASCTAGPFSGIIATGDTAQCSATINASFNAGEGAYWHVYATASGISLNNTFLANIAIGISQ